MKGLRSRVDGCAWLCSFRFGMMFILFNSLRNSTSVFPFLTMSFNDHRVHALRFLVV